MTDVELNEAVARKLGWTDIDSWIRDGRQEDSPFVKGWIKDGEVRVVLPDYNHSIEAAWEMLEGRCFFLKRLFRRPADRKSYFVVLCGIQIGTDVEGVWVQEEADTAPRAICLAFLKLPEPEA